MPTELRAEMPMSPPRPSTRGPAARANDDYGAFRPWLDRMLELKLRYIACFPPADEPYDVLLDDFEQGMQTARCAAVFDRLKPSLDELVGDAPRRRARAVHRAGRFPRGAARPLPR